MTNAKGIFADYFVSGPDDWGISRVCLGNRKWIQEANEAGGRTGGQSPGGTGGRTETGSGSVAETLRGGTPGIRGVPTESARQEPRRYSANVEADSGLGRIPRQDGSDSNSGLSKSAIPNQHQDTSEPRHNLATLKWAHQMKLFFQSKFQVAAVILIGLLLIGIGICTLTLAIGNRIKINQIHGQPK